MGAVLSGMGLLRKIALVIRDLWALLAGVAGTVALGTRVIDSDAIEDG